MKYKRGSIPTCQEFKHKYPGGWSALRRGTIAGVSTYLEFLRWLGYLPDEDTVIAMEQDARDAFCALVERMRRISGMK